MKNLTPEIIEKAKIVASVEELLELAKANNVELTAEDAATYFAQMKPKSGELDDDDLDAVAGGGCSSKNTGHVFPTAHWFVSSPAAPAGSAAETLAEFLTKIVSIPTKELCAKSMMMAMFSLNAASKASLWA